MKYRGNWPIHKKKLLANFFHEKVLMLTNKKADKVQGSFHILLSFFCPEFLPCGISPIRWDTCVIFLMRIWRASCAGRRLDEVRGTLASLSSLCLWPVPSTFHLTEWPARKNCTNLEISRFFEILNWWVLTSPAVLDLPLVQNVRDLLDSEPAISNTTLGSSCHAVLLESASLYVVWLVPKKLTKTAHLLVFLYR